MSETLTIEKIENHVAVKDFIQKVLDLVYTEDEGMTIRAELLDHILSLSEDFEAAGHSSDMAVHKALHQMGDPAEIGYSFTDYEGMKRRRRMLVGLKILGLGLMLGATFALAFMTGGSGSGSNASAAIDSGTAESGGLLDSWLSLYYIIYFPFMLWINLKTQAQHGINGIPIRKLKLSKEPLLVLWSYKKRFPMEYLIISVFFVPILIVFAVIIISEGESPLGFFGFISAISIGIWLLIHSEKFRIPKYLILEEGLVIKNNLVTWTSIDRIYWTRDYMSKGKGHYKLTIEHIIRNQGRKTMQSGMTIKRNIDVNANQYHQVNSLIKERIR